MDYTAIDHRDGMTVQIDVFARDMAALIRFRNELLVLVDVMQRRRLLACEKRLCDALTEGIVSVRCDELVFDVQPDRTACSVVLVSALACSDGIARRVV